MGFAGGCAGCAGCAWEFWECPAGGFMMIDSKSFLTWLRRSVVAASTTKEGEGGLMGTGKAPEEVLAGVDFTGVLFSMFNCDLEEVGGGGNTL